MDTYYNKITICLIDRCNIFTLPLTKRTNKQMIHDYGVSWAFKRGFNE